MNDSPQREPEQEAITLNHARDCREEIQQSPDWFAVEDESSLG
jgi:hypothetical protein